MTDTCQAMDDCVMLMEVAGLSRINCCPKNIHDRHETVMFGKLNKCNMSQAF